MGRGDYLISVILVCSSGWVHTVLRAMQNKNKSSSKQRLAFKDIREFGKRDDKINFREPGQLPVLLLTPLCLPIFSPGPNPLETISIRVRWVYEHGESHHHLTLCIWLWAMLQAWSCVEPIHFRSGNIITITSTKQPHFHHSAFIDRYEKEN